MLLWRTCIMSIEYRQFRMAAAYQIKDIEIIFNTGIIKGILTDFV